MLTIGKFGCILYGSMYIGMLIELYKGNKQTIKARTHRPIFTDSVVKSAYSSTESADSAIDSVIVSRLPISNMFNILNALESASGNRPTIAVGRRKMGLVDTGINLLIYSY